MYKVLDVHQQDVLHSKVGPIHDLEHHSKLTCAMQNKAFCFKSWHLFTDTGLLRNGTYILVLSI